MKFVDRKCILLVELLPRLGDVKIRWPKPLKSVNQPPFKSESNHAIDDMADIRLGQDHHEMMI